jgi:hypothetical protein
MVYVSETINWPYGLRLKHWDSGFEFEALMCILVSAVFVLSCASNGIATGLIPHPRIPY